MSCPYCENQETILTYPINNNPPEDVIVCIRNGFGEYYLSATSVLDNYGTYIREQKINYCPFCGREL